MHPYARGSLQRIPLEGGQGSFENLDEAFPRGSLRSEFQGTHRVEMEDVATLVCVTGTGPIAVDAKKSFLKLGHSLRKVSTGPALSTSVSRSSDTGKQSTPGPTRWIWQFSRPFGP